MKGKVHVNIGGEEMELSWEQLKKLAPALVPLLIAEKKEWRRIIWPWITVERSDKIIKEISEDYEKTLGLLRQDIIDQTERHLQERHDYKEEHERQVSNLNIKVNNGVEWLKNADACHKATQDRLDSREKDYNDLLQSLKDFFRDLDNVGATVVADNPKERRAERFVVSFKPELDRPGGGTWGSDYQVPSHCQEATDTLIQRELTILHRIATKIGLKDWEWVVADGVFKRTYYGNCMDAPADIKAARGQLQGMLGKALDDELYHEIIHWPAPAKDGGEDAKG